MVERDRAGGLVDGGDRAMTLGHDRRGGRRRHRHIAHVAGHGCGGRRLVGLGRNGSLRFLAARGGQGGEAEGNGQSYIGHGRSEEHTSELQSLMRLSYAVFCLKKKKQTTNKQVNTTNS